MEQLSVFSEKFQDLIGDGLFALTFEKEEPEEVLSKADEWTPPNTNNLSCSYCRVEFSNAAHQREHYKLDWHRYNLKQSLLAKVPVSEEEFSARTDDVSSISGSESEEEETLDTLATAQGKLFLKNAAGQVFGMYRCLFVNKKTDVDDSTLSHVLRDYFQRNRWTVLMLGGGHFAGAIFEGGVPILHKTFHCYTVRAGQGGSQSTRDNQSAGSQPKSAGASLRRYNEMSLNQHVKDIVDTWRSEMAKCSLIVYRAAGPYNKSVLFGGKTPLLDRGDARLRTVPFSTRRATFAEVKQVHAILTTVSVYDSVEAAFKQVTKQKPSDQETKRGKINTRVVNRAKSRETVDGPLPSELDATVGLENASQNEPVKSHKHGVKIQQSSDDVEDASDLEFALEDVVVSLSESLQMFGDSLRPEERRQTQKRRKKPKKSKAQKSREQEEQRKKDIYDVISGGNIEKLHNLLNKSDAEPDSTPVTVNEVITDDGNSLLHVAAMHAHEKIVGFLLENGADPCLKNFAQQTPYTCTQDKHMREIFKAFAKDNPDKYNYNKAQIPVSMVDPEELAEKRRLQKKAKREKEKLKKKDGEIRKQEELERERFLKLSDREKRALAAERRILNQSGCVISRCFLCAADMSGKVPFEYLTNRFCSIECLKAHRLQHPIVLS